MQKRLGVLAAIMLSVTFTAPVQADFERGFKAYRERDRETALREFKALAEQGDPAGQFYLGVMYANGEGVTTDKAEAARWYLLSAEQGYLDAQQKLALSYRFGDGVPQDYVSAHMWYSLAAGQGSIFARIQRDLLVKSMTPEQLAEAQRLAGEWTPK